MFEMKNETDTTSTKHKNEDFFKELDKDRCEKKCEYAVLVSLLESDSELYNGGIVDVSYRYPKMFVIRPQFFIPLISLLRNAALSSLSYRRELSIIRDRECDLTNFEDNINTFKESFARNYRIASDRFKTAIEEIDKTILHLQKTKDALLSSENNLRIANNKADELSIKRLTRNAPHRTRHARGYKNTGRKANEADDSIRYTRQRTLLPRTAQEIPRGGCRQTGPARRPALSRTAQRPARRLRAPKEVIAQLSELKNEILCVRGNCDTEVDQMVLPFPLLADYAVILDGERLIYATHGHVYGEDNPPPLGDGDILLCGHTHVPKYTVHDGYTYVNPGSVSIPKEGSRRSYMTLEDGIFIWKDLDGEGSICAAARTACCKKQYIKRRQTWRSQRI